MIDQLPHWINLLFLVTFGITIVIFYLSNGKPKFLTILIVLWSIVHSVLAYNGFYQVVEGMPPRFALVLIPSTLWIIYGLLPKQRKWMLDNRNISISTFMHSIRVPMEIVLWGLMIYKMVPELMTFEGRNFDILAGLTAPIVGILFLRKKLPTSVLLIWNVLGLMLISFILINGVLSAELPFQQFGFEQPNKGINFFPFILLPATIVPLVIYTHITDILLLLKRN